jgi:hypothetical protein
LEARRQRKEWHCAVFICFWQRCDFGGSTEFGCAAVPAAIEGGDKSKELVHKKLK